VDERLEKAFQTANYMATLGNLRKTALEEYNQSLIYYFQGSSFTVSRELIVFVHTLTELGNTESIILDDNRIPLKISNLQEFLDNMLSVYNEATNEYLAKYADLRSKRRVGDLVNL
jgi:hypothetical protein